MNSFLSRVVIRHLPPSMSEEQFMDQVSPLPDHNYFHFAKADLSLGPYAFCRAVLNFTRKDDIFVFKDKFDGYVFLDSKGNEYPCTVEFSLYQKVPHRRSGANKRRDPKCGTIQDDPDFKIFMESLTNEDANKSLPSAEVYLEEIEARCKDAKANKGKVTTPLIEYLKQKKAEKLKLKEERREERRKEKERDRKVSQEVFTVPRIRIRERDRERDLERERTKEREREKAREREKERERERAKMREKEKERNRERDMREKNRERNREREKEKRERDREKEKERDRERPRVAREMPVPVKINAQRAREKERESTRDRERDTEKVHLKKEEDDGPSENMPRKREGDKVADFRKKRWLQIINNQLSNN